MKKIIYIMLATILLSLSTFGATGLVAFAEVSESECDKVFLQTLTETMSTEEATTVTATKELLHDITLQPLGYLYVFETEQEGYAIVINSLGFYECTEIYYSAQSPYENYQGTKVYIKEFAYCVYDGENYINADTGLVVEQETIDALHEKAYFAGLDYWLGEETVNFTARTENRHNLATRPPQYIRTSSTISGCVPIAGTNIMLYHTRYKPNLMPGFTPGTTLGAAYLYKVSSAEIDQLAVDLRDLMKTDSNGGTSIPQFKDGMSKYATSKGYSISFNSVMSGGNFNFNTAKQRLSSGQPLIVFVDPFNVSLIELDGNKEYLLTTYVDGAHAMASFGYREITYTLASGQTRVDNYIQVASGLVERPVGFCRMNSYTVFDDAYGVDIY